MCRVMPRPVMAVAVAWIALLTPAVAAADFTPAPGYAVADWATGFPTDEHAIGPVGLAVEGRTIYVGSFPSGRIYGFDQDAGGVAGPAAELTGAPIAGQLAGIAIDRAGRLYAALKAYGSIVELSRADGHVLRTVTSGLPCAVGLAVDPLSGDLFVSQPCGTPGVKRVGQPSSSAATVSQYTLTGSDAIDGIEFGADGTLYAASETAIHRVAGTNRADAGASAQIASIADGDGIAVGASADPARPPFLLVVTTRGTIERIDMTQQPATVTVVASGGSRGDLAVAGSDGCLYATQSDRVVKLTSSDGTCGLLTPSTARRPSVAAGSDLPAQTPAEAEAAKRSLQILSLTRSARMLSRARSLRVRARLLGPSLYAVRATLVDSRGRTLASGRTARLAGVRTLTLKRTRRRVRPGLVRLRVVGLTAARIRTRLVATRRLTR